MGNQPSVRADIKRAISSNQQQYNQDDEIRRFQEARRREEAERVRREQEFIRRRMAPKPEDPQMDARGQPYWPYNRPMVGGRVTKEVVDVMDNVPGVNRLTGPAKTVAAMATGGAPPMLADAPILRVRQPKMTDNRSKAFKPVAPHDLSKYGPEQRPQLAQRSAQNARDNAAMARRQAQVERQNGNNAGADYLEEVARHNDAKAQFYTGGF